MNYKVLPYYLGIIFLLEAAFMLLPLGIAAYYREYHVVLGFAIPIGVMLALALAGQLVKNPGKGLAARQGFIIVTICWCVLAFCGAFPYWISGEVGGFGDCLFESVSGFTTTAASVVADVQSLSKGLQMWRALSLWIGGMGVLAFLLAVMPFLPVGQSFSALKAESPGLAPGKLVPRLRKSAMILYGIYMGLTALETLLLALGGMPLFDSVVTSMATAGTGGFSVRNASVGGYGSLYTEVVVMAFMFLCGMNYNLLYFLIAKKASKVWRNDEWRAYVGILAGATLLITANLLYAGREIGGSALRAASFQVLSIATTTGFTTADISVWPQFSQTVLFVLMFVGACMGSSGGGLKVVRLVVLLRESRRVLHRMLHPRSVGVVKLDGKRLEASDVHNICNYFLFYIVLYFGSVLVISLDSQLDFETILTATAACINNVGAGMGLVASGGQYVHFSTFGKLVLMVDMLLGRLELYPLLLLFSRHTWRKV